MADGGARGQGVGRGAGRDGGTGRAGSKRPCERDLFVLHAQRIVDVASGETMRHELFLRMVDEDRLIPAGEFVLAAEELGSIREIDRWVVGTGDRGRGDRASRGPQPERALDGRGAARADPGPARGDRRGSARSRARAERGAAGAEGRERGAGSSTASHELGCRIALDGYVQGGRGTALLKRLPIDFVKLGPQLRRRPRRRRPAAPQGEQRRRQGPPRAGSG